MANLAKRMLLKSRDIFQEDVVKQLDQLDSLATGLKSKVEELTKVSQAVFQEQAEVRRLKVDLIDKISNTGTIVLSKDLMITKLFSGLKIYLDPHDLAVAHHIALDSIWEYQITPAWLSVVKPADTIVDIGANFAYFGALAAQITDKKKSKVIFFEANPHLIPYINKTLSLNWLNEQSIVENIAIADKPGNVTLKILKDYIGSSSVHPIEHTDSYMHNKMHIEAAEEVSVLATTLDDYCQKHNIDNIDLIKMDIEGFEDIAYKGMRKIIQSSPGVTMFIEFTRDSYKNPKQFYDQMLDDFGNVYIINEHGELEVPRSTEYSAVIGDPEDWVMPVFSKSKDLAKSLNPKDNKA